jgi:hypothetical protein
MSENEIRAVLTRGAWADGSSWTKVIAGLRAKGLKAYGAAGRRLIQTTATASISTRKSGPRFATTWTVIAGGGSARFHTSWNAATPSSND